MDVEYYGKSSTTKKDFPAFATCFLPEKDVLSLYPENSQPVICRSFTDPVYHMEGGPRVEVIIIRRENGNN